MRLLSSLVVSGVWVSSLAFAGTRGDGVIRTETRKLEAFHEVSVGGGVKLKVKKGEPQVALTGDQNLLPLLTTTVSNGRLKIEHKEWNVRPSRELEVVVTVPSLDGLEASGGVEATLEATAVDATKLTLELSGGVELDAANLSIATLTVDASGGVKARLSGKAKTLKLDLSGGVEFDASKLDAATAVVDASGGCTVKVRATESLTASASGGVDLRVGGNPAKRNVHTSGGADVSNLD